VFIFVAVSTTFAIASTALSIEKSVESTMSSRRLVIDTVVSKVVKKSEVC